MSDAPGHSGSAEDPPKGEAEHGRLFMATGAVFAGLAVASGAMGSHLLESRLSVSALETFETAARYQMYHGLGLLAVGWSCVERAGVLGRLAGCLMVIGVVLFAGSLYALALGSPSWLGAVTPLGGVALICSWGLLAVHLTKR